MSDFTFLQTRRDGPVAYVTLNRPDSRNAFNELVITELTAWARAAAADGTLRAVVLAGSGPAFSAGADMVWMAKMVGYSRDDNLRDAQAAAAMYLALDTLPIPLIGRIHGAALGGGAGLAAICDVAVADEQTVFGFTEVRLGIVPAMISPYVLAKIGPSAARELFLTGRRFTAVRAKEIGLVHDVVPASELDARVASYVKDVLSSAPEAIATAKLLLRSIAGRTPADVADYTAETIATRRVSAEGQEGLRAFLEKRTPSWTQGQ